MDRNLEQEIVRLHADICSALADPTRILILYALAERVQSVSGLAAATGISQSTASRHLKVLRERALVGAVRHGPNMEYRLMDHRLVQALDLLRVVLRDGLTHRASLMGHSETE